MMIERPGFDSQLGHLTFQPILLAKNHLQQNEAKRSRSCDLPKHSHARYQLSQRRQQVIASDRETLSYKIFVNFGFQCRDTMGDLTIHIDHSFIG